jgi:hypothetical protein
MHRCAQADTNEHKAACGDLNLPHHFDGSPLIPQNRKPCSFPGRYPTAHYVCTATGGGCGELFHCCCGSASRPAMKDHLLSVLPHQRCTKAGQRGELGAANTLARMLVGLAHINKQRTVIDKTFGFRRINRPDCHLRFPFFLGGLQNSR